MLRRAERPTCEADGRAKNAKMMKEKGSEGLKNGPLQVAFLAAWGKVSQRTVEGVLVYGVYHLICDEHSQKFPLLMRDGCSVVASS